MSKILVTGGCGFIGSNFVKFVLNEIDNKETCNLFNFTSNYDIDMINVIDDLSSGFNGLKDVKHDKLHIINKEFSNDQILSDVRNGIYKHVFHFAAKSRIGWCEENAEEAFEINVYKTIKLIEACKKGDTPFTFSSSSAVYGKSSNMLTTLLKEPISIYGIHKSMIEDYLKISAHWKYTILRYFNVYGPGDLGVGHKTAVSAWCQQIKNGEPITFDGNGDQSRDMIFVEDVAKANLLTYFAKSDTYQKIINVGSGESITNNMILRLMQKRLYKKGRLIQVQENPTRKNDIENTKAKYSQSESNRLFYSTPFETGLELTMDWWKL